MTSGYTIGSSMAQLKVSACICALSRLSAKLIRFIENHDEPRAAATFSSLKAQAAAVTVSTLQGAVLFHDGQFEGRRVRLPVFLRRRPEEPTDHSLEDFYRTLLKTLRAEDFKRVTGTYARGRDGRTIRAT